MLQIITHFPHFLYEFIAHFHTFLNHRKKKQRRRQRNFSPSLPFFHTLMLHFLNLLSLPRRRFATARKFLCFRFLLFQSDFSFSIAFLSLRNLFPFCCVYFFSSLFFCSRFSMFLNLYFSFLPSQIFIFFFFF